MKYIMLETADGAKLPVIFPDCLTHSLVAGAIQMAVDCMDPKKDLRPKQCLDLLTRGTARSVSAGFVGLGTDVTVSGESESLGGLKSVQADAARIVCGESIQFMPDALAEAMLGKLRERGRSGADSDAAVAIGEHAFRAGWAACDATMDDGLVAVGVDAAWSDYTPPEDLRGVAL